ncbi:MAG: PQQ-like beta-propeller repeat protein [Bryobacterales bacterium]|nr:PQQ-like beta-propeller repeat protein [Bryobacterales bacterium]
MHSLALLPWLLPAAAGRPQFRGPQGMGLTDGANLFAEVGADKNLVWKTPLSPGHSSPILAGDRNFLTAYVGDRLLTIALDRGTGKLPWRREAPGPRKERFQPANSPASPSPVSGGEMVCVFFGDFGLLAFGKDGDERRRLPPGPFNNDRDTDLFLIAPNKNTGKARRRAERPEVTRGYATPGVYIPKNGRKELTTLNPETGAAYKQARLPRAIEHYWASPAGGDGKVYLLSEACKLSTQSRATMGSDGRQRPRR